MMAPRGTLLLEDDDEGEDGEEPVPAALALPSPDGVGVESLPEGLGVLPVSEGFGEKPGKGDGSAMSSTQ